MGASRQRLLPGRNGRSQLLTGLRGVGTTVMLNEFEHIAQGQGYVHEHIKPGDDARLAPRLAAGFLRG